MSRFARIDHALLALALVCAAAPGAVAASKKTKTAPAEAPAQRIDEEYTKLIKQYLQDPRITTELVDHMPASDTVPSPLKFFGRIPGTPGELTYAKDINRYYRGAGQGIAARASSGKSARPKRAATRWSWPSPTKPPSSSSTNTKPCWPRSPIREKQPTNRRAQLIKTGKPIYWLNSGIHSPETGGPEMLIELAFRLMVEETPFIQAIRNNVIVFITPVIEVDGREKAGGHLLLRQEDRQTTAAVNVLG